MMKQPVACGRMVAILQFAVAARVVQFAHHTHYNWQVYCQLESTTGRPFHSRHREFYHPFYWAFGIYKHGYNVRVSWKVLLTNQRKPDHISLKPSNVDGLRHLSLGGYLMELHTWLTNVIVIL